jgi:hypothetical protein
MTEFVLRKLNYIKEFISSNKSTIKEGCHIISLLLCVVGFGWSIYYINKINKDIETEKNNTKKDSLKTSKSYYIYNLIICILLFIYIGIVVYYV